MSSSAGSGEAGVLAAVASLPFGVAITDVHGIVTWANAAFAELTGRTPDQLVGQSAGDLAWDRLAQAGPSSEPWRGQSVVRRKTGEACSVEYSLTTIRSFSKEVTGFWIMTRDATGAADHLALIESAGRKRAEEALRESERQYRELFDSAPMAYHEVDRDGVIRQVNRAECALLGYQAGEMLGRPACEFIVEADREASRKAIRRKLSGEQPLETVQRRFIRRDGGELWLEVHDILVCNAQSEIVGLRTALLDITERKRAEEYRKMNEEVLQILNGPGDLQDAIQRVLTAVNTLTRCDAIGMRLQDGEDFPYFAQEGFSEDFLLTEHTLIERAADGLVCRDKDGAARLECTCGLVISGKTDPANPLYTRGGSCWTNDSSTLLDLLPAEDPRHRPRNQCIHHGYASVALVPIRNRERIVGLIHLNGRSKGRFTLDTIELLEGITSHIGEALMRKRTEEALRESEEEFRTLFVNGPDALYLATLEEGRITDINDAFEALFEYSREEAVGKTSLQLNLYADPADRARVVAELKAAGRVRNAEMWGRKKSGKVFFVSLSIMTMMVRGEAHLVGAIRDITERKRAEEEREHLHLQLAQAQKMESIGRLAGGVAHDFNNLLTVINGFSQMLLAKLRVGDPLRDSLEAIHRAGERAAGLTRQLLAFSRKQVLEPRRLDVNRVVEDMRQMLERLVGEDVEVRIALGAKGGTIHADPHQLEQVVMNLAVNSRDAMPHGGKLSIETAVVEWDERHVQSHSGAREGRYVVLSVSDSGVGMDEETKSRIFEPFFTTKEVGKGTGLGLSMVQGIVAQSGGYIEVHSEKGRGTTFEIYLPALAAAAADSGAPAAVPALGGRETVLVVEDQAEVRDYAGAVLKSYGYRVILAENAGEALLLCERERIDLVLTDVVMPNVGGRELAGRLGKLRPGLKVLFMSGYTDDMIANQGALDEFANFIQKPFSPEELAGKVREVLEPPAPAARILVVDDETGVRSFLRKALEDGGYEVIEAADGKQALRQALVGHVDLVITDLVMPEQEGIETIRALRRDVPGVGIVAISGAFQGQFLKPAQLLGADAVMRKPVSAELLLARVAEVLKTRR